MTAPPDAVTLTSSDARRMTDEEARAVLTLVRGGWLRLVLPDAPEGEEPA